MNCGSVWAQTFAYDAFGNITKSGSQSFQPGYSPQTNQMVSLPGSTPTYDLDGNVTYDGANNYGWDANGNMVTVNSTTSTFDALGRLASQTWPGEIMWLPAGLGRIFWHGQVADVTAFNLPGGDQAIISEASGVTRYAHADHLGSGRLESGTDGTFFESMAYAPYGETYAQSQFDAGRFTGEGVSFALGLYDSQTRELSDAGRWVSPDPAGVAAVDPTDPQTWNRYAYVRGSATEATDPSGMCQNGHAACPPLQSPKYFVDGPFGPVMCAVDGLTEPCEMAQQMAQSGAAGQISGGGLPIAGNNGQLYQPVLTGDGPGYMKTNGDVFYDGSELGLPNIDNSNDGLPQSPSWWGIFFKTLATNFVSPSFYKSELDEGGCLNVFIEGANDADILGKIIPATATDDVVGNTIKGTAASGAFRYAAENGLTVPMRSSVVRGMIEKGETGAGITAVGYFDYQAGAGVVKEWKAATSGACH